MMKNNWPTALFLIVVAFIVLMGWSINRARHSPGTAVVPEYAQQGNER